MFQIELWFPYATISGSLVVFLYSAVDAFMFFSSTAHVFQNNWYILGIVSIYNSNNNRWKFLLYFSQPTYEP